MGKKVIAKIDYTGHKLKIPFEGTVVQSFGDAVLVSKTGKIEENQSGDEIDKFWIDDLIVKDSFEKGDLVKAKITVRYVGGAPGDTIDKGDQVKISSIDDKGNLQFYEIPNKYGPFDPADFELANTCSTCDTAIELLKECESFMNMVPNHKYGNNYEILSRVGKFLRGQGK